MPNAPLPRLTFHLMAALSLRALTSSSTTCGPFHHANLTMWRPWSKFYSIFWSWVLFLHRAPKNLSRWPQWKASTRPAANVVSDEYDEHTHCVYSTDALTEYRLRVYGLLLIGQMAPNDVTKRLCFERGLMGVGSTTRTVFFFHLLLGWVFASSCCPENPTVARTSYNAIPGVYIVNSHDLFKDTDTLPWSFNRQLLWVDVYV